MTKPFVFPGLSLQNKLPLLICILLLCTVVIFTYTSYEEVKKVSLSSGSERLHTLTDQISSMFVQMGERLLSSTQKTANLPPIQAYMASGGKDSLKSVQSLLAKEQQDTLIPVVQLFDVQGHKILEAGSSKMFTTITSSIFPIRTADPRFAIVGKLYKEGSEMYFPIIVSVTDGKQILGYFVKWRMLITTPAEIEALSQLMGARSAFYIGNDDGSFWTNGIVQIKAPPVDLKNLQKVISYDYDGSPLIASAKEVANTHWLILITLSQEAVTATANQFLYKMIAIGAALTVFGIFFAWLISRSITTPLQKLIVSAESVAKGNYSHRLNIKRKDELGKLANAFDTMSIKRKKYEDELRLSQEQLRQLAAHLQNIREEERLGIAREIHDVIGQLLTAIKFDVHWLRKKMKPDNDETDNKLSGTLQLLDETIHATRKISSQLRPDILNDLGLIEALRWQTNEFQNRTGISCRFSSLLQHPKMETSVSFGLYRIYQEALTNIARHANATQVDAGFEYDSINGFFVLRIADNGNGFDPEEVKEKKRLGIVGIKERVLSMNGECTFETATGKGVTIIVRVPE
ncbi:HAMP domain-containing protein [Panacibacter ginsenosidivorans]|uniref:histidine kinase n=1 Tax=Panacibacter ginsenosidivorans TaxID=1813871 RepID=A0A5B8V5P4_9BACT|nr:sensor histidine kinase [Panacibacter ginsenosidivorans]QEC66143.1 HAMP domain-containing protein [Panacibacter ginsenosidivorans]